MSTLQPRHYRSHDGLLLAADVGGDPAAPPVLLLHGGGQTRHSWGGAARELVRMGYQVITLDLRGHGDSEWSATGDYSLGAMAQDVRTVARTLAHPPALVGASLGGLAALLALGETAPGEAPLAGSALVLVDVVARLAPGGAERIQGFMSANPEGFASLEAAADAIAEYLPHRPRPSSLDGLRKNLRQRDDGRWYWHWDPAFMRPRGQITPIAERMEAASTQVRCPTLIVRGGRSELVDAEGVRLLQQFLPHAEAVDVAGAHHMVAGDRNDAFNAAIESFLRRHLPSETRPDSPRA